jgi:hypothetical protein
MKVSKIVVYSIKQAFELENFLPFFLLYLLTALSTTTIIFPVINRLPEVMNFKSLKNLAPASINLIFLLFVLVLFYAINIAFEGVIIYITKSRGTFSNGLKYVRKVYPGLLAFTVLILIINSLLSFVPFGFIVSLIIGWFLMFTKASIVIKRDPVELGMMRSVSIVNRNKLETLVLIFLIGIISFLLASLGLFTSFIPMMTTLKEIEIYLRTVNISEEMLMEITKNILIIFRAHYFEFLAFLVILSFFFSIIKVFGIIATTIYFIKSGKIRETF